MAPLTEMLWAEILDQVRREQPAVFAPWFGQLRCGGLEHGLLRIVGPDAPRTDWLRRNAAGAFTSAAQAATGHLIAVEFITGGEYERALAAAAESRAESRADARADHRQDTRSAAPVALPASANGVTDGRPVQPFAGGLHPGRLAEMFPSGDGPSTTRPAEPRSNGHAAVALPGWHPSVHADGATFPDDGRPHDGGPGPDRSAAAHAAHPTGDPGRPQIAVEAPPRSPVVTTSPEADSFADLYLATPANLSPEYNFENFVIGPSNRFAHAACFAAGENPGRAFNPLFLQGNVGLGKTHLLQAVGHEILRRRADARVLYLSCESFVNDFVHAIERNQLPAFRSALRRADCLIVDDIQFLTEGDRTQEEFFHTFNTLHQAGRQLILSADVGPDRIQGLEERLVSRFKWGLVTQIDQPALETRIAILKRKARLRHVDLPDDVARLVAEIAAENIRQLEGALTSLQHASTLERRPIDMALARETLRSQMPAGAAPPGVSVPAIIEASARQFAVKTAEVVGRKRTRSIAMARMVAMYVTRKATGKSLEEIGEAFGGKDHTTVLHAVRRIEEDRVKDPEVGDGVRAIAASLGLTI